MSMNASNDQVKISQGHYANIGHYDHDIEVLLHSKFSLRLVGGRKADPSSSEKWAQHEVIGLIKYAPAAIRLYNMAYQDNPYVDESLVLLEKRLEEAEDFFEKETQTLTKLLNAVPSNVIIKVVQSTKPFHLKPKFGGNPYANKGLLVLGAYDHMMTLMETCRAYGLIKRRKATDIEYKAGRAVRRVFVCPGQFVACDVTRADITNNNEKAKAVMVGRGAPKESVMLRNEMPKFGPKSDSEEDTEAAAVIAALNGLSENA